MVPQGCKELCSSLTPPNPSVRAESPKCPHPLHSTNFPFTTINRERKEDQSPTVGENENWKEKTSAQLHEKILLNRLLSFQVVHITRIKAFQISFLF